jgi:hypothetical protein
MFLEVTSITALQDVPMACTGIILKLTGTGAGENTDSHFQRTARSHGALFLETAVPPESSTIRRSARRLNYVFRSSPRESIRF